MASTSSTSSSCGSAAALGSSAAAASAAACSAVSQHPIGLGTMMMDKSSVSSTIRVAVEAGYRRIDCAPVYFNEEHVGDALDDVMREGLVKREELFVTSKLPSTYVRPQHVEAAARKTLRDLKLSYLDLYLIHWPVAFNYVDISPGRGWPNDEIDNSENGNRIDLSVSIMDTWPAMEALVDKGLVKYIGVSNFPVILLHELLAKKDTRIPPAVNQCERHLYLQNEKLLRYCVARNVHFQAYSALGTPGYVREELDNNDDKEKEPVVLQDPVVRRIAEAHNVSVAAVCLAWALRDQQTSVVVKSTNPEHLRDNLAVAKSPKSAVQFTEQELEQLAALDRNYRYFRPEEWWENMPVAVFD